MLSLVSPTPKIRGYARRYLAELQSNLFVGKGSRRLLDDLISRIETCGCDAVLVIEHRRSETGFRARTFGNPDRHLVDLDGIQLVARKIR